MNRGQSSILWTLRGVSSASSLRSSSTVSAPRSLKSFMGARQSVNPRQLRSARHERVLSLKISWWMTHDTISVVCTRFTFVIGVDGQEFALSRPAHVWVVL
jgi:hypothetical protein